MASTPDHLISLVQTENDAFRLVIRGHALIDAKLDDILTDAFVDGKIPGFLKGPTFRRKVELVIALGLVPRDFEQPILAFTKLRDELAHGRVADVDLRRARSVFRSLSRYAPSAEGEAELTLPDERAYLMVMLASLWAFLSSCEHAARLNRERAQRALIPTLAEAMGLTAADALAAFAPGSHPETA